MSATAATIAAVLLLGGTGVNVMPPATQDGIDNNIVAPILGATTAPAREIRYAALPWDRPQAAAPAVLDAIATTPSPTVVVGISKGAQVTHEVSRLLAGKNPSAPVTFVRIGDPDRNGGAAQAFGIADPVPPTPFETVDVYAQYDGFADWPDRFNPLAAANAVAGIVYVHPYYGTGAANDPLTHIADATVTVTPNGNGTNTTSYQIPTTTLPLLHPLTDLGVPKPVVDALDAQLRPIVDAGYSHADQKKPAPRVKKTAAHPKGGSKPKKGHHA